MKLILITFISLPLLATGSVDAQQPRAAATSQTIAIARSGTQAPRQGPAENFTGSVRVDPLFTAPAPARSYGASVTFEPAARTAWHSHSLGQTLIVTSGVGRVQQWAVPSTRSSLATSSGLRPA
jgi:4-carboxymuconolactone decarboxylase